MIVLSYLAADEGNLNSSKEAARKTAKDGSALSADDTLHDKHSFRISVLNIFPSFLVVI